MPDRYTLVPDEPWASTAFGFVSINGGRNIPLPGKFHASVTRGWVNDKTGIEIVERTIEAERPNGT